MAVGVSLVKRRNFPTYDGDLAGRRLNSAPMIVPKNIQFSRYLKAGSQLKEFNFRRRKTSAGAEYAIDVCDERGIRFYFSIAQAGSRWAIQEPFPPEWIREAENLLVAEIELQESHASKG